MKKLLALAVVAGLLVASVAFAQVYEKGMNMFEMAGKVEKYESYDTPKEGGLIGRLYVYPHGGDPAKDSKKIYITKETEIVKKEGGAGAASDLTAGAVVLVRYKKVNDDMLRASKVELK
ncbi:MAG: hypothetical protein KJ042_00960 [Deltaproteobacteria bacterium]|nr:hypothetical protein [Deltaproteobacteria bacterium]